jgi:serine/threonine-protein kinase RsbW
MQTCETGLILAGDLGSLDAIADYVMKMAAQAGLERNIAYHLRLAVDEIATNIIVHGYNEAGLSGNIEVGAVINEQALTILLEDTGVAYQPQLDHPPESINLPLAERPIGGLGVYLAAHNVDEFSYERNGERNRHTFVVKRPKSGD